MEVEPSDDDLMDIDFNIGHSMAAGKGRGSWKKFGFQNVEELFNKIPEDPNSTEFVQFIMDVVDPNTGTTSKIQISTKPFIRAPGFKYKIALKRTGKLILPSGEEVNEYLYDDIIDWSARNNCRDPAAIEKFILGKYEGSDLVVRIHQLLSRADWRFKCSVDKRIAALEGRMGKAENRLTTVEEQNKSLAAQNQNLHARVSALERIQIVVLLFGDEGTVQDGASILAIASPCGMKKYSNLGRRCPKSSVKWLSQGDYH
ncbi:MAG: hypothetical protein SGARI_003501 [Bacillariaceae sp.]